LLTIKCDGETLKRLREMTQIRCNIIYRDEGEDIEGDGSGSKQMDYLQSSIVFQEMT